MLIFNGLIRLESEFKNTKRRTERSETMLEKSDDYPKGEITNRVKTGGVANKKDLKTAFLTLFNHCFSQWDILYRSKLGNNAKTLGQITPLWSFFSPDEWHECCNKDINARKGSLCHYKLVIHTLEKILLPSQIKYLQGWIQ